MSTDRGEADALSVTTVTCWFCYCVGKKRSKPLDSAELPSGNQISPLQQVITYNASIIGSKKKTEGSVEPVSKEKKRVIFVDVR